MSHFSFFLHVQGAQHQNVAVGAIVPQGEHWIFIQTLIPLDRIQFTFFAQFFSPLGNGMGRAETRPAAFGGLHRLGCVHHHFAARLVPLHGTLEGRSCSRMSVHHPRRREKVEDILENDTIYWQRKTAKKTTVLKFFTFNLDLVQIATILGWLHWPIYRNWRRIYYWQVSVKSVPSIGDGKH